MQDMSQIVAAYAAHCGYTFYGLGIQIPRPNKEPDHLLITNFPSQWREEYDSSGYMADDPVIRKALQTTIPTFWNDCPRERPEEAQVMLRAAKHGLSYGITAPFFGRRGVFGLLSFARMHDQESSEDDDIELKQKIVWFVHAATERTLIIHFQTEGCEDNKLTAREAECVKLSMDGLSTKEIAKQMGVQPTTVSYFLAQAGKRLHAKGRNEIVAKAIRSGALDANMAALLESGISTSLIIAPEDNGSTH